MENRDFARILYETGDLMEIAGEDGFRIRSYRNGASIIEGYPERVSDILADSARKVTDIPGIGKGLAAVLKEIETHGSFDKRDELLHKFPSCALDFLKIQGLGPKSIALLFEHFHVQTMDELEQLCRDQKLRTLPRMGAKLEEKVLRGIMQHKERSGRFLLSFADNTARELNAYLSDLPGIDSITPAGSLRRGKETIGDLDLLVTGPNAAAALESVAKHPRVQDILGRGANKTSVKIGREGLQVDVRALEHESFGAAMQYFTGSKEHNVALRQRAIRMGFKLSEYGLFRIEDDSRAAGETEEGIYRGARPRLDSSGTAREPGRDRTGGSARLAEAGGAARYPRRSAHAHHGHGRPRHARRDGGSRPRSGLRIHRHHGPFESHRHGLWSR